MKRAFEIAEVEVTKRDPEEVHALRRNFKKIRKEGEIETHHVIPLSLGGTNEIDNLVLLNSKEHAEIHRMINAQVLDMEKDETRKIKLPVPKGLTL